MSAISSHARVQSVPLVIAATSATVRVAACGSTSGLGGTGTVAQANAAALRYANCMCSHGVPNLPDPMRAHGVPNFPDPTFGTGGAGLKLAGAGQLDPESPAFQQAARVYNGPRLQIAIGGPRAGGTATGGG